MSKLYAYSALQVKLVYILIITGLFSPAETGFRQSAKLAETPSSPPNKKNRGQELEQIATV